MEIKDKKLKKDCVENKNYLEITKDFIAGITGEKDAPLAFPRNC